MPPLVPRTLILPQKQNLVSSPPNRVHSPHAERQGELARVLGTERKGVNLMATKKKGSGRGLIWSPLKRDSNQDTEIDALDTDVEPREQSEPSVKPRRKVRAYTGGSVTEATMGHFATVMIYGTFMGTLTFLPFFMLMNYGMKGMLIQGALWLVMFGPVSKWFCGKLNQPYESEEMTLRKRFGIGREEVFVSSREFHEYNYGFNCVGLFVGTALSYLIF